MVCVLLLSALALYVPPASPAQGEGHTTIYRQVVSEPDPANGYEDFLRAADVVNDGLFDVYANWMPTQYKNYADEYRVAGEEDRAALTSKLQLSKELSTLDQLRVDRAMVDRYGRAIDFVALGNQKNVYEPRNRIGPETMFPEYRGFRQVSRLLIDAAYVDFADGKDQDGAELLRQGLEFSQKSGTDSIMIADLVSVAMRAITLRAYNSHLDRVPISAWEKVVDFCDAALADTKQLARCIAAEKRAFQNTFQSTDPKKLADSISSDLGKGYPGATKAVQSMSGAELTRLASDVVSNAGKTYEWIDRHL